MHGGSPVLTGLLFIEAGRPYLGGYSGTSSDSYMNPIAISAGSTAIIRDNRLVDSGGITVSGQSEPLIEGNAMSAEIYGAFGDDMVIRGNTFTDLPVNGIVFSDPSSPLIEGNTIDGAGGTGITSIVSSPKLAPTIRDNTFRDTRTAILLASGSPATVTVESNTISDVTSGITVYGGAPSVTGNTVDALATGIDVGANASPTVDGNTVCGGMAHIKIHDTATPTIGENTTC